MKVLQSVFLLIFFVFVTVGGWYVYDLRLEYVSLAIGFPMMLIGIGAIVNTVVTLLKVVTDSKSSLGKRLKDIQ